MYVFISYSQCFSLITKKNKAGKKKKQEEESRVRKVSETRIRQQNQEKWKT